MITDIDIRYYQKRKPAKTIKMEFWQAFSGHFIGLLSRKFAKMYKVINKKSARKSGFCF